MAKVVKICVFTILTLMVYLIATAKITAQEISSSVPAPLPVSGSASQPTVSRPLILFSLLLFFNYVSNSLLANTDDDPYAFMSIDSEQNLFANVISNNPSFYEEFVPTEMHHHEHLQDYNQIGSLISSNLQEVEYSTGNFERDNGEQNNLHSENRAEGTLPRVLADEGRVVLEEVDDAVERSSIDLNTLDSPGLEERVREYVIDLNALILPNSKEIEQMDDGRSRTEHNLPAEERDSAHEERVDIDQVAGLDEHVVVIDSDTSSSEEIEPDMEYGRPILPGETSQPHGVDTQMQQTTVDGHINNCSLGITFADLQQQSGKKVEDAAASLGVSRSTFKRRCRDNGIARWSRKRIVQQPATATLTQSNIGVKVSYNGVNVKFPLSLSSGKKDLEVEIEKRFGIQTGSFWIKYEDEDKDWIHIICDEDLHHGMQTCVKTGITTMKMLVG